MIRIFTDFNALSRNRVPLFLPGSVADIREQHVELHEGLRITVYDGDYESEAVVEDVSEKWYGLLIEGTGHNLPVVESEFDLDKEHRLWYGKERPKGEHSAGSSKSNTRAQAKSFKLQMLSSRVFLNAVVASFIAIASILLFVRFLGMREYWSIVTLSFATIIVAAGIVSILGQASTTTRMCQSLSRTDG